MQGRTWRLPKARPLLKAVRLHEAEREEEEVVVGKQREAVVRTAMADLERATAAAVNHVLPLVEAAVKVLLDPTTTKPTPDTLLNRTTTSKKNKQKKSRRKRRLTPNPLIFQCRAASGCSAIHLPLSLRIPSLAMSSSPTSAKWWLNPLRTKHRPNRAKTLARPLQFKLCRMRRSYWSKLPNYTEGFGRFERLLLSRSGCCFDVSIGE